jgi:hypothetical protein
LSFFTQSTTDHFFRFSSEQQENRTMNQQHVAAVCHIVETNSMAAELLQELRSKDAVALLRQGMQCMLENVVQTESSSQQEGDGTPDESVNTPSSSRHEQHIQHLPSPHDKDQDNAMDISYDESHLMHSVVVPIPETDLSVSPDTLFRVFSRALVVTSDVANKLFKSTESELSAFYDSLSATIMYNTGLALHSKAIGWMTTNFSREPFTTMRFPFPR